MRTIKRSVCMLLTVFMLVACLPLPTLAASTRKCYTINTGNTTVYSNTGLSSTYGTIYDSDEITVIDVTSSYCKVSYPTSRGSKTGYIHTSAILTATSGNSYSAKAQLTTYKRPGGASYGYISKGDTVTVLGTSGNYRQVKYPVSGGYKYAFVTSSDASNYITGGSGIEEGMYRISTALNGNMRLDVSNNSMQNGANIQIYENNGSSAQLFKIQSAGSGWYMLRSATNTNMLLDVAGGVAASDVNVQLYEYNGSDAQKWTFESAGDGKYLIKSKLGYYLDVCGASTNNGTNVIVYSKHGNTNQQWILTKEGASATTSMTSVLYGGQGGWLTCGFDGYKSEERRGSRHEGIDFKCALNASVYSLTDGIITRVTNGSTGSGGLSTIAIYDSAANKTVVYLHTAPVSGLQVGQTIAKGTKIATESWRGVSSSSSAHTHVEVRDGRKTAAAISINDPTLDNPNPTPYWNSKGYTIK